MVQSGADFPVQNLWKTSSLAVEGSLQLAISGRWFRERLNMTMLEGRLHVIVRVRVKGSACCKRTRLKRRRPVLLRVGVEAKYLSQPVLTA